MCFFCVFFFLHSHAFSHNSDGNESYEYACTPRAFCTKACCRYSFPSCALFLFLCHCLFLCRSLSQTLHARSLTLSHESISWMVLTENMQCEDESLYDIVQKSKDRLKITVCSCVCMCMNIIIQFDRLSPGRCSNYSVLLHSSFVGSYTRFHNLKTYPIM